MNERQTIPPAAQADRGALPQPSRVNSASLFAGRREIVIVHNGEDYRLRITRQQKLILTK